MSVSPSAFFATGLPHRTDRLEKLLEQPPQLAASQTESPMVSRQALHGGQDGFRDHPGARVALFDERHAPLAMPVGPLGTLALRLSAPALLLVERGGENRGALEESLQERTELCIESSNLSSRAMDIHGGTPFLSYCGYYTT